MKKIINIAAMPFKAAWEWYMEFFYITVHNGRKYYKKSSTKAIRSLVALLAIACITLVVAAFYLKLFGSKAQQKLLTAEILGAFVGLNVVVNGLLGWLQSVYTKQKVTDVEKFKP